MFRPEIAVVVDSGDRPPLIVAECVSRALRAEFHLTEAKEEKVRYWEAKKKEKAVNMQNPGSNQGGPWNKNKQNNRNNNKRKVNFSGNKNQNQRNQ